MDAPARLRGTRPRFGIGAQQQRSDARGFRGQRDPAAGGQVEHARVAPQLDHRRADARATHDVDRRAQQRDRIGEQDQHDPPRVDADRGEAGGMDRAAPLGRLLAQPDERARRRADEPGEHRGKPCGAPRVFRLAGKQFVQPPAREPAADRGVDSGMAERDGRGPCRIAPLDPGELPPQHAQRIVRLGNSNVLHMFYSARGVRRVNREIERARPAGRRAAADKRAPICHDRFFRTG